MSDSNKAVKRPKIKEQQKQPPVPQNQDLPQSPSSAPDLRNKIFRLKQATGDNGKFTGIRRIILKIKPKAPTSSPSVVTRPVTPTITSKSDSPVETSRPAKSKKKKCNRCKKYGHINSACPQNPRNQIPAELLPPPPNQHALDFVNKVYVPDEDDIAELDLHPSRADFDIHDM
jgi:hypothetical protein